MTKKWPKGGCLEQQLMAAGQMNQMALLREFLEHKKLKPRATNAKQIKYTQERSQIRKNHGKRSRNEEVMRD